MPLAIGMIECISIARGVLVADAMVKAAQVVVLLSRTICCGKHITMVGGDVAAVRSALEAGQAVAGHLILDHLLLPNVHPAVLPALQFTAPVDLDEVVAVGVLETLSVAAAVVAADAAVKAARVSLLQVRSAMAIGGKGLVVLAGEVASVQAAVDAGVATVTGGLLVDKVVIPHLHRDVVPSLL